MLSKFTTASTSETAQNHFYQPKKSVLKVSNNKNNTNYSLSHFPELAGEHFSAAADKNIFNLDEKKSDHNQYSTNKGSVNIERKKKNKHAKTTDGTLSNHLKKKKKSIFNNLPERKSEMELLSLINNAEGTSYPRCICPTGKLAGRLSKTNF